MESAAGLAALALFVLWLGYWVPQRLRHRQQLLESRVDDRFSGGLRVLAVAGGSSGRVTTPVEPPRSLPVLVAGTPHQGAGGGERGMPEVRTGRALERRPATGATPAGRAARSALLERRAARARRRLTVTLLLTVLAAAGWAAVGLGHVPWWGGAAPTALLGVVLVLGRLAVLAARRDDRRWAAEQRSARRQAVQARTLANGGPYAPRNRAGAAGRGARASAAHTQLIPRVGGGARPARPAAAETSGDEAPSGEGGDVSPEPEPVLEPRERPVTVIEQPTPGSRPGGVGGEAWDPVPVPLPTYVTKPEAPRREPRPLTGATPVATSAAPSGESATEPAAEPRAGAGPDERGAGEPAHPRADTLGLPLEQILARRRAAG